MSIENKVPAIRFKGFSGEWVSKKLGDKAEFLKGQGYSKNDLSDTGNPIILYGRLYTKYETAISVVDTFVKDNGKSIVSKGNEVIVPASGETAEDIARASAVIKSGILLGGDLNVIYPNNEIDSIFLAITISNGATQNDLSKRAQGKSVVHVRNADLKEITIHYPNKNEQTKISNYLQQIDTLIAQHQQKHDKLLNLKKSLLEKMFPKQGKKEPQIRFKGFSGEWEKKEIQEVANRYDNLRIPVTAKDRISGSTPYYGANGIQDYVEGYTHDGEFVLVAEDGANDLKNYPIQYVNGKVWVNNHAHVLQTKQNIADNYFLMLSISNAEIESLLVGGGRAKLNAEIMMKIVINISIENEEQIKIGNFFRQLDTLINQHQAQLKKLNNIKQACLEKLFV